jgi:uncharacterized membrane protein YkoI
MINKYRRLLLGLCAVCLISLGTVSAQEKRVTMKNLPPAVRKTVEEQTKGATIKGLSKEKENGKTQYEVETVVAGHTRDILIDESGAVVEIEETVDLNTLPEAVQSGIKQKAGKGRILRVEALTKNGTLSAYEVQLQRAGRKSEFQVSTDGTPIPSKK